MHRHGTDFYIGENRFPDLPASSGVTEYTVYREGEYKGMILKYSSGDIFSVAGRIQFQEIVPSVYQGVKRMAKAYAALT